MASFIVAPKNCVVHNSDPLNHAELCDTSSECGSLCTCTSGSITSIATIVSNHRDQDRLSQDDEYAALTAPVRNTQVIPHTEEEDEENRYFLMRVTPRIACCRKLRRLELRTSLRHYLLISTEFFPWIAGIVFIYYSYHWWGLASGFSSFFLMIGVHAIFRFVKAHGVLTCALCSSEAQEESSSINEDDVQTDLRQRTHEIPTDTSSEKPPSYDMAVVKPPPYDLKFHLTPKELHNNPTDESQQCPNTDHSTVLSQVSMEEWSELNTFGENNNDILPSYHDVMKLTLYRDGIDIESLDEE